MKRLQLLLGISVFWLALSLVSDGITTLILPQRLLSLESEASKATTLGLMSFVGLLAGMLVQPIAGRWSDQLQPHWGRRGTLLLGVLLMLVSLACFGWSQSVLALLIGYLLIQVTASIAQAAQQGFMPDLVPTDWRGTAAGFKGFTDIGGALLGFAVLGQLLKGGDVGPALLVIATVLIGTLLLTIALVHESTALAAAPVAWTGLVGSFRIDLHQHRGFVWLVASRFLFLLGTYAVGRFLLFFVGDELSLDAGAAAEQTGVLLASLTLITVIATLPAGWAADRLGRKPLMVTGALLSAAGVLALAVADTATAILLAGSLMAIGSAAFGSANWALTVDVVPSTEAARFLGLANIGTAGAAATAGLFGPIIDWANTGVPGTGYKVLFAGAALAFLASMLALRGLVLPCRDADQATAAVPSEP